MPQDRKLPRKADISTVLNFRNLLPQATPSLLKSMDQKVSGISGDVQRHPLAFWQTALGISSQIELHRCINAKDPLRIPVSSFLAELISALPETSAEPLLNQFIQD